MSRLLILATLVFIAACKPATDGGTAPPPAAAPASTADAASARLAAVLDAQPADTKARYAQRHPRETLEFFGIRPGMTVVEALPGQGWYTRILLPYLGAEGHVWGVDYPLALFKLFGFFSDEALKAKETWATDWAAEAAGWRGEDSATVSAFVFGAMPEAARGTADAVLMIRALHNLARFDDQGGHLSVALADAFAVLKPGGVLGVVQHEARPEMPDEWASGRAGYLKKDFVIARITAAGFEFVGDSDINANPADQPTVDDVVWRLPPNLRVAGDDAALKARYQAIGESNRMTLLFRKPQ